MTLIPFTIPYAREKFPGTTFSGRTIDKEKLDGWFGNNYDLAMQNNGVVAFVKDGKTMGACADVEKLELLDVKDVRNLYKAKTGEDAAKTWTKDFIILKLTGNTVS